jgi:hypothetical protein
MSRQQLMCCQRGKDSRGVGPRRIQVGILLVKLGEEVGLVEEDRVMPLVEEGEGVATVLAQTEQKQQPTWRRGREIETC